MDFFCGPQESKCDKHESAAEASGGEAEADAQERAVRKPFQCCRTGCERAHCSTYIMLQRRHFFLSLLASTEPMATLRHRATCESDVAAACANALTSWSDFVRQSVTPSSPSSGYEMIDETELSLSAGGVSARERPYAARQGRTQLHKALTNLSSCFMSPFWLKVGKTFSSEF